MRLAEREGFEHTLPYPCDKLTRRAKIRFSRRANHPYESPHLVLLEGALAIVTERWGRSCGGRGGIVRGRDGRAGKLRERFWNVLTSGAGAYGKSVWTRRLTVAGVKSCGGAAGPTGPGRRFPRGDGGDKGRNSPRLARDKPSSHCAGNVGCSPLPCMLVCAYFYHIAHETAGAARIRHSLLPCFKGETTGKPRAIRAARSRTCIWRLRKK